MPGRRRLCFEDLTASLSPDAPGWVAGLRRVRKRSSLNRLRIGWGGLFLRLGGVRAVLRAWQPPCSPPAPSPDPLQHGAGCRRDPRGSASGGLPTLPSPEGFSPGFFLAFPLPPLTPNPLQKKLPLRDVTFTECFLQAVPGKMWGDPGKMWSDPGIILGAGSPSQGSSRTWGEPSVHPKAAAHPTTPCLGHPWHRQTRWEGGCVAAPGKCPY